MIFIEPQAGATPITQLIDQSHHEIDVGVYYLADRKILSALQTARARGVVVRVMVEPKPYGMKPWQVHKEAKAIEDTGAQFKWVPSRFVSTTGNYVFYHAKYVCNGHECEVGTANFDWSAFHKNREYLYVTKNPAVVTVVHQVFDADWNRQRVGAYAHRALVLSPGSTQQLLRVIDQPGPVEAESEELGNDPQVLAAMEAKGRDLRLILPSSVSAKDQRNVATMEAHGVQVRLMPKGKVYMHAKMIVGRAMAFIGSENFTETSLEKNREIGLLLDGRDVSELQGQFDKDWALAGGKTNGGVSGFAAKAKGWLSRF